MNGEIRVRIASDIEIVAARRKGRELATAIGFSLIDQTLVATAISELARNILLYAKHGEIILGRVEHDGRSGIVVVARDEGPGIPDIGRALERGYSTSGGLGLGLWGVRRLMDEFDISSTVDRGTTITTKKWG